jgi:hypothetical protein
MGSLLPDIAFNQKNISPGPSAYGYKTPMPKHSSSLSRVSADKNYHGGFKINSESRANDKHLND